MDRTALTGREYAALQTLFATVSVFDAGVDNVRARCERAGCWDKIQAIRQLSNECLDAMLKTVPERKLEHIRADLKNVRIYIKTEPPGLSTPCTAYSYTPTAALNDLLNHVCQTECVICDKTAAEAKKCPYRQMIDNALPHEVDNPDREHCKYSDMVLGL